MNDPADLVQIGESQAQYNRNLSEKTYLRVKGFSFLFSRSQ